MNQIKVLTKKLKGSESQIKEKIIYNLVEIGTPYFSALHSWIRFKKASEIIRKCRSNRILDVWCGYGLFTLIFEGRAIGVDINIDRLKYAKRIGAEVLLADVKRLPFKDNTFDCVSLLAVIEHIPNFDYLLEIKRVLKPNGYLVLDTPNSWYLNRLVDLISKSEKRDPPDHVHIFDPPFLKSILERYDFRVLKFYGTAIYPIPRRISRKFPKLVSILGDILPLFSCEIGVLALNVK